jgi:hypothetical protein
MGQNSAAKWAKIWPPNGPKLSKKSQINFVEVFFNWRTW